MTRISDEDLARAQAALGDPRIGVTVGPDTDAPVADELRLPCDVQLPPATILRKGVKLSTLHEALRVRGMVPAPGSITPSSEGEWVLVPRERTLAMHDAMQSTTSALITRGHSEEMWNAALAASPAKPPEGVREALTPEASDRLGAWLSAALDDPGVCAEMKADINAWFSAGQPLPEPSGDFDFVAARAWDFVRPKLVALNEEKGPAGVWSNGFRAGWTYALSHPQGEGRDEPGHGFTQPIYLGGAQ